MVAAMKEKKRHEIIQSWFRCEIKVRETIAVHNLNTTAIVHGQKKRRTSYTRPRKGKQKNNPSLLLLYALQKYYSCTRSEQRRAFSFEVLKNDERVRFHPGRPATAQKRLLLAWEIVVLWKPKVERRRRKELFYCHCCRVCVVKGARRQKAATTSSAIVGLLRYVYMRIIWLIMPLLCLALCEKANGAIWIALNGFYISLTIFHLLHDVLWFSNSSRNPNLLAFYFLYRAKEIVTHFLFTECFAFKCSAKFFRHLRNREKLPSFVIKVRKFVQKAKYIFRKPIWWRLTKKTAVTLRTSHSIEFFCSSGFKS